MVRWSLDFSPEAEKDLAKLDHETRRRVIDKLDWLIKNFDSILPLPLHADFKDFYKLRVGDWRAAYKIDWKKENIIVCYIDHRGKIYKKKQ
jgi:addiction module RelE/StbE family toxin